MRIFLVENSATYTITLPFVADIKTPFSVFATATEPQCHNLSVSLTPLACLPPSIRPDACPTNHQGESICSVCQSFPLCLFVCSLHHCLGLSIRLSLFPSSSSFICELKMCFFLGTLLLLWGLDPF